MAIHVLIRGGGDLASGVALRLFRAGIRVMITELPQPLAVRRKVCFAEAVYSGETTVEGVSAKRVQDPGDSLGVLMTFSKGKIPVLIDPEAKAIALLHPSVIVDARMLKRPVELDPNVVPLIVGLGPGFTAGVNCHAAVETNRGHFMGRVYWQGAPQPDTGVPEGVAGRSAERVLRAPEDGSLQAHAEIGDHLDEGQLAAEVSGAPLVAPFAGVLRGLLHPGAPVTRGMKVGDVDPRDDPRICSLVSDKALAVGGGVLEAILSKVELRRHLWD
jgi:xanthine dehydrogenase accessory factor